MLVSVEGVFKFRADGLFDFFSNRFIDGGRLDSHFLRLDLRVQFFLNGNDLFDGLMTEIQRLDHHFLGNFIGAGFNHHDAVFHTRHRKIQPAVLQFRVGGIQVIAAIDQSHSYCRDRRGVRNVRKVKGRRRPNDGMHRGIDVGIG